jgi:hypothetical protein
MVLEETDLLLLSNSLVDNQDTATLNNKGNLF